METRDLKCNYHRTVCLENYLKMRLLYCLYNCNNFATVKDPQVTFNFKLYLLESKLEKLLSSFALNKLQCKLVISIEKN